MSLFITPQLSADLPQFLHDLRILEPLLDAMPSVVFFVKNTQAQYEYVNQTLVTRCGCQHKNMLIGKTSAQVFPKVLGQSFISQDLQVLQQGKKITGQLELHLYAKHTSGWCLTYKEPIYDVAGNLVGIVGISNDLNVPERHHPAFAKMLQVEKYLQDNCAQPISLHDLTSIVGTSVSQLERYFKKIYHLSPRQMLTKIRLEKAILLLSQPHSIADVAIQCGYTDQSAFTRQFKLYSGLTPTQYRLAFEQQNK